MPNRDYGTGVRNYQGNKNISIGYILKLDVREKNSNNTPRVSRLQS